MSRSLCLWVYFLLGLAVSRGWGKKEGKKEWLCQHNPGASGPSGPDCHPLQKGQPSPRCSENPEPQGGSLLQGWGGWDPCSFSVLSTLATKSQSRDLRAPEASKLGQMRKPSQETGSDGPGHSSTDRCCYVVRYISLGKGQPLNPFSHFSCQSLLRGHGVGEVQ